MRLVIYKGKKKVMSDEKTIGSILEEVSNASTTFENTNTDLKRKYLLWNIASFDRAASTVSVKEGIFGTGYPFYALDEKFQGELPIISEQIRYNRQLIREGKPFEKNNWPCKDCLSINYSRLPDLKTVCKPCPRSAKELKPRKIMNRLPDIDMWLICKDGCVSQAEKELSEVLHSFHMFPSDKEPLASIKDVCEISEMIRKGIAPKKYLPIDSHIIEYSVIKDLINETPGELIKARASGDIPFLPILPKSFRKVWQYDDEAYNFIYDYLSAFTPFGFSQDLEQALNESREKVVSEFMPEELFDFLLHSATSGNFQRFQSPELERIFLRKMESWKERATDTPSNTQKINKEIEEYDFE